MAAKELFEGGETGVLFTDRRKFYLGENKVSELWPDVTPFTTFLMKLGVQKVDDPLFKMFQHKSAFALQRFQNNGNTDSVPANGAENTNAISIDNITGLNSTANSSYKGLVCEVWDSTLTTKKGVCIITTASTTIKVKNAKTTAFTLADNDYFVVIGNVRGEGSVAPDAWADELKVVWNSTQFFSTPVEVTGKLYETSLRGYSNELARLRTEKAKEHKFQQEQSFLKGVSTVGTNFNYSETFTEANLRTITDAESATVKLRMTYGYIPILEDYGVSTDGNADQNIFSRAKADYSYAQFVDDMEILFDKRAQEMAYAFSGRGATSYWSKMGSPNSFSMKSGWTVKISDFKQSAIGFKVRTLETPHGDLLLASTKALRNQYNSYMCVPDETTVFISQFKADEFKNNVKTNNDYDGVKDVYNSDKGFGMDMLEKNHLIKLT